jgi:hypothetical protein
VTGKVRAFVFCLNQPSRHELNNCDVSKSNQKLDHLDVRQESQVGCGASLPVWGELVMLLLLLDLARGIYGEDHVFNKVASLACSGCIA